MALPYRSRRGSRASSGPESISLISPSKPRDGTRSAPEKSEERTERKPRSAPTDPVTAAREYCLNLLTARPLARAELHKKLIGKGYEEDVAERVLNRLHEVGLIDDAAVAELWVRSRHNYQGMARRALSIELRRKGVADEIVADAVSAVDSDAEEARARELVRKRLRGTVSADEVTMIRRLVGMLARKGYSEGLAYRVVKSELRDFGSETDLLDMPNE
jgi:regulatory protein